MRFAQKSEDGRSTIGKFSFITHLDFDPYHFPSPISSAQRLLYDIATFRCNQGNATAATINMTLSKAFPPPRSQRICRGIHMERYLPTAEGGT